MNLRTSIFLSSLSLCLSVSGPAIASDSDAYAPSQGWSKQDAKRWYTLPQGSRLIKQSWLNALKDNEDRAAFSPKTMSKYGYVYGSKNDALPLGFTVENDQSGTQWVGLNCSACHTAVLKTPSAEVLIHGGQTMADFQRFLGDLISNVETTFEKPDKFAAFSKRVVDGGDASQLKNELAGWLKLRKRIQSAEPKEHKWGRGRADAVGVILAKTSVVVSPDSDAPLPKSNAPVSYPFIWNTNQQALLQHNGVVSNGSDYGPFKVTKLGALIRNWTEVLGVFGQAEMNPEDGSVTSSIHLENLLELEQILARLKSPRWPVSFGEIDEKKHASGKKIYREHCAGCHANIEPNDLKTDIKVKANLTEKLDGPFLYMQPIVDISVTSRMQAARASSSSELIGTDPLMACNSTLHTIETGMLRGTPKLLSVTGGSEEVYGDYAITTDVLTTLINKEVKPRLGELGKAYLRDQSEGALDMVRNFVRDKVGFGYAGSSYDPEKPGSALDQFLAMCADQTVLAHLRNSDLPLPAYKARPLNGVWATAPYLHNGSVPTLHDLLKPQNQRPRRYGYLDGQFDTKRVGLVDRMGEQGATVLDVYNEDGSPILGNWNGGHEYGTNLSEHERLDLIEYLKGL